MTEDGRIPIVIGVTGHRALLPKYREPLRKAVKEELASLREKYPHSPLLLLTSLAEGADLLCADTAAELFPRTQREECPWVLAALCALTVGPPPREAREIRRCWVEDQRDYHEHAEKKSNGAMLRSDAVVRVALCASIALYVLALLFELLFGGILLPVNVPPETIDPWGTLLKLALGLLSAATLFTANYYGKQSLSRTVSDHGKMKRFYAKVDGQLERFGQTEDLLRTLASEELAENGNWCSYQRDNAPDISL